MNFNSLHEMMSESCKWKNIMAIHRNMKFISKIMFNFFYYLKLFFQIQSFFL